MNGTSRHRSRVPMGGTTAALLLAGAFVLAACDDTSDSDTAAASPSTTVAASSTSSAPVAPAELPPEAVARDFLDAYGAFDADEALTYLTEDAIATGAGNTWNSWGSPDAFRAEVSMAQAWHVDQTVTSCENQGESGTGVAVRCAFDSHSFRSNEIGRGPFSDNWWDIVVQDGKITSAVATWSVMTNGFSAEMWQPFQAWVTGTHPEDLQTMYPVGDASPTEESIRLWDERLREWAEAVKADSG